MTNNPQAEACGYGTKAGSSPRRLTMKQAMSRRDVLTGVSGAALCAAASDAGAGPTERPQDPFTYSLNTSTIRGQNLSIVEEVDIAARAGYQAIEPWIN